MMSEGYMGVCFLILPPLEVLPYSNMTTPPHLRQYERTWSAICLYRGTRELPRKLSSMDAVIA